VLQHGNAKNSKLWFEWVPLLANDFRVIHVDARGFGRSSIPFEAAAERVSLERYSTDIAELLDLLEVERAHVVGETLGGAIALSGCTRRPTVRRVGS
jgi:pimeloyl-ACP methyl ester carboxylesterase